MSVTDDLMIGEWNFFGAVNNQFRLSRDEPSDDVVTFEAVEDECDGYRSMLEDVTIVAESTEIFYDLPLDRVRVVASTMATEGWDVVSVLDGHTWLTFGTDYAGDYYPSFAFTYTPKAGGK